MKIRFTAGRVRVRLDDLETASLARGEQLETGVTWAEGGWSLILDPLGVGVRGEAGRLTVGLKDVLPTLLDPAQEGVALPGPPRVDVEKDYGPQHE
ncbi:hypothetical protein [Deinococcus sp. QL22]|uniref:hypothetical protein n=1 Tax=Deinococcus sp. QL22 TaxID=2939437 RepID=UPI0020173CE7|nr:hypothetical protein [Deinococcus sp. QL22]UQN07539.1 hypothetical protein M1R55_06535 [Deinococcus sp. QL22]